MGRASRRRGGQVYVTGLYGLDEFPDDEERVFKKYYQLKQTQPTRCWPSTVWPCRLDAFVAQFDTTLSAAASLL